MQIRTIPPVIACAAQSALMSLRCRFSNVYENISSNLPKNKNKKSEWSDDPRLVKPEEKTQDENHNH